MSNLRMFHLNLLVAVAVIPVIIAVDDKFFEKVIDNFFKKANVGKFIIKTGILKKNHK